MSYSYKYTKQEGNKKIVGLIFRDHGALMCVVNDYLAFGWTIYSPESYEFDEIGNDAFCIELAKAEKSNR